MSVIIPFAPVSVNSEQLEIDCIGSFAIEAKNSIGQRFYFIAQTESGVTRTITYGPVFDQTPLSPCKAAMKFETIYYDSRKIISAASRFLLSKNALEAEIVDIADVIQEIITSIGGLIR